MEIQQNGYCYRVEQPCFLQTLCIQLGYAPAAVQVCNPNLHGLLQEGCTVFLPARRCPQGIFYTLRPRDTLLTLSSRLGLPVSRILEQNGAVCPEALLPGSTILLPGESAAYANAKVQRFRAEEESAPARLWRHGLGIELFLLLNPVYTGIRLPSGGEYTAFCLREH